MKNAMTGVAAGADKVVGDIILGGLGRCAFHLNNVPLVGDVTSYVGENVRDGYQAEALRCQKKTAARAIASLMARKDTPTSEEIREFCVQSGVAPEHLDRVAEKAEEAVKGKADALRQVQEEMNAPETRRPAPPSQDVPLPGADDVQGSLATA